jgi:hypothetical protein
MCQPFIPLWLHHQPKLNRNSFNVSLRGRRATLEFREDTSLGWDQLTLKYNNIYLIGFQYLRYLANGDIEVTGPLNNASYSSLNIVLKRIDNPSITHIFKTAINLLDNEDKAINKIEVTCSTEI